jgi:hypothetical protein
MMRLLALASVLALLAVPSGVHSDPEARLTPMERPGTGASCDASLWIMELRGRLAAPATPPAPHALPVLVIVVEPDPSPAEGLEADTRLDTSSVEAAPRRSPRAPPAAG